MEPKQPFNKRFKTIELLLSLETLYLSVILLLPFDTFSLSKSYDAFRGVATETQWGYIIGGVFLLQFGGMALERPQIRLIGLLCATGLYFAMGTMFILTGAMSTAWGTYYILGLITATLHLMVAVQVKKRKL